MDPRRFDDLVKRFAQGTSRRKVLKGFAGGIAGVFAGGVAKQSADAAPDPKVTICHFTHSETNPYNIITVSSNSQVQHHLNHGDSLFGNCCLDSDCSVPGGTQCAIAVCRVDRTGTSFCGLDPNPGASCDDGIACTENDLCGAGVDECNGTPNDKLCDDGNACTTDTCEVGVGCTVADVDCDDGNACTTDSCDPASGCIYEDVVCDDGNICTADSCDPATGCINTPIDGCCFTDDDCPEDQVCIDNVCTDNPSPQCVGLTCDTFTQCSAANSDCVCGTIVEGGGLCVPGSTPCAGLADCNNSGDCPADQLCATASCCQRNVCVPVVLVDQCPQDTGLTSRSSVTETRECISGTFGCA